MLETAGHVWGKKVVEVKGEEVFEKINEVKINFQIVKVLVL